GSTDHEVAGNIDREGMAPPLSVFKALRPDRRAAWIEFDDAITEQRPITEVEAEDARQHADVSVPIDAESECLGRLSGGAEAPAPPNRQPAVRARGTGAAVDAGA